MQHAVEGVRAVHKYIGVRVVRGTVSPVLPGADVAGLRLTFDELGHLWEFLHAPSSALQK